MKKLLLVVCGVLSSLTLASAADHPVKQGVYSESEFWILTLSDKQLEEVELARRVTLSKEQLQEVRAVAPTFPKTLGVASPFVKAISESRFAVWSGQVTGIWYCRDKVAVPLNSLNGAEGHREFNSSLHDSDAVLVDTAGGYAIGSRRVDSSKLMKSLDKLAKREPRGANFEIFVLRPPVLRDNKKEAVVEKAVTELAEACQQRGLGCRIGG